MLKYLIIFAVLLVTMTYWLPSTVGGDTSYHFVLTDSMRGTLDPGSFVILRKADSYRVGEAVGYKLELGNGETVTILHRIIGRLPEGKYLMKGDAVESTEEVEEQAMTGRMVAALPALGFLPGAFRAAPMVVGALLLAVVFLAGGTNDKNKAPKQKGFSNRKSFKKEGIKEPAEEKSKGQYLFFPAALLVLLALPFATDALSDVLPSFVAASGLGDILSTIPMFALLLGVLGITRLGEVYMPKGPGGGGSMAEINYGVVMILAVSMIPLTEILSSVRGVLTF